MGALGKQSEEASGAYSVHRFESASGHYYLAQLTV